MTGGPDAKAVTFVSAGVERTKRQTRAKLGIELVDGDRAVVQGEQRTWRKKPYFAIIQHRLHWAERRRVIAGYDNVYRTVTGIMFKMTECYRE